MNENIEQQDLNEILRIRRQKLSELQQAGKDPFQNVKYERTNTSGQIVNDFKKFEGKQVSLAGRIIARRMMGKASFCNILDQDGKIQSYIRIDEVGEEKYEEYKKYDIGDIVGIKGEVFKTHTGEISIKVKDIMLLSKSLQPLPEKWHGLKDTDLRYRQRYVDLIVNTDVRDTFIKRSKILKAIRSFLDNKGFLEVETPILNVIPGGAAARPFMTHHNTLDIDLYLRISPELYLKRLIVGGLEKVYEMGRVFRNEGISIKHNPEFSILELYQAYTDYHGMMDITEELMSTVTKETLGTTTINYQGQEVELSVPWTRITMIDAVKKYTGVDFSQIKTDEEAREKGKELKLEIKDAAVWGEVLNLAFEEHVEKKLIQPTFIMDYPVEVSPLSKRKPLDPRLTERFELFMTGREMANAYSELNDPIEQKERFLKQVEARNAGDEEANMMDDDFVNALEYAMPPTGGLGIGIDRFIMLLTESYSIRDVLLFPTMKPRE